MIYIINVIKNVHIKKQSIKIIAKIIHIVLKKIKRILY